MQDEKRHQDESQGGSDQKEVFKREDFYEQMAEEKDPEPEISPQSLVNIHIGTFDGGEKTFQIYIKKDDPIVVIHNHLLSARDMMILATFETRDHDGEIRFVSFLPHKADYWEIEEAT